MSPGSMVFTYEEEDGSIGTIPLDAVHTLWIDRNRTGVVFAEPDANGSDLLYEVVLDDRDAVEGMTSVMHELLEQPGFEYLEEPLCPGTRSWIRLEFRHPSPHAISLAYGA